MGISNSLNELYSNSRAFGNYLYRERQRTAEELEILADDTELGFSVIDRYVQRCTFAGYNVSTANESHKQDIVNEMQRIGVDKLLKKVIKYVITYGGCSVLTVPDDRSRISNIRSNHFSIQNFEIFGAKYVFPLQNALIDTSNYFQYSSHFNSLVYHESWAKNIVYSQPSEGTKSHTMGWGVSMMQLLADALMSNANIHDVLDDLIFQFIETFEKSNLSESSGRVKEIGVTYEKDLLEKQKNRQRIKSITGRETIPATNDIVKLGTPLTGVEKPIEASYRRISMITKIPVSILFSGSAGEFGKSSSESDIQNWGQTCIAFTDEYLRPFLEYVINEISLSLFRKKIDYSIEFLPPFPNSEKELQDEQSKRLENLERLLRLGVSPEIARNNLFQKSGLLDMRSFVDFPEIQKIFNEEQKKQWDSIENI